MTTNTASTSVRTESRTLTLGEALQLAKRLKGEHAERGSRAAATVMHVDGKEEVGKAFSFVTEDAGAARACENLVRLKTALSLANARVKLEWEGGKIPLAEGVIRQQEFRGEIARIKALPIHERDETRTKTRRLPDNRYEEEEVVTRHRSHLTERARTDRVATLQQRLDGLTAAINRVNARSTLAVELLLE